ncbi:conserved hypothetical protein [Actinacidiphila bryophytorum]|uniref:Uncharacterized protein n=1 Tax=Actinacidiphila bryophytorum TaxID=1436133 RepID=A0A9W4MI61_9ACTN|nr:conserved hypothetical protein [Actinacidiphila bryophytorum]
MSTYRNAQVTPDLPPRTATPDLQGQGGPGPAGGRSSQDAGPARGARRPAERAPSRDEGQPRRR